MNRKTAIIIIIAVILVGAAVLLWIFFPSSIKIPFLGGNSDSGGPKDLFPFGDGNTNTRQGDTTGNNQTGTTTPLSDNAPIPVLREISQVPIGGATVVHDSENEITYIRFLERSTGHIFETTTDKNNAVRITNTTIPRVQNVAWNRSGNAAILQYEGDTYEGADPNSIISFYGVVVGTGSSTDKISTPPAETSFDGIFLPGNITNIATSPDKKHVFTLETDESGVIGFVSNFDGSGKKEVFSSPLTEWQVEWPQEKTLTLVSNASTKVAGFVYSIDVSSGKMTGLLSQKKGLVALVNPTATAVLYSEQVRGRGTVLHVYTIATNDDIELPIATFAEKCAWGTVNKDMVYCGVPKTLISVNEPDEWYQGITSYSDGIWSINSTTGAVDLIIDLEAVAGKGIDVSSPFLDEKEGYLFFTNKNDLHLWSLKIGI